MKGEEDTRSASVRRTCKCPRPCVKFLATAVRLH